VSWDAHWIVLRRTESDSAVAELFMANARKTEGVDLESSTKEVPLGELEKISELDFSREARKGLEAEESRLDRGWTRYGWLLWDQRRLFYVVALRTLIVATLIVFLLRPRYESAANIMPPEQGDRGALLSLLAGRAGGTEGGAGLASLAGSVLGVSSTGALFVELAHSRTVEDRIIDKFGLGKVYGVGYRQDARRLLEQRTAIGQDRKSGVISIQVTDTDPQRAREIAQAYVDELDRLLSEVSTSSARRERIFIEQRLVTVKSDLDEAEKQFSAFASKNTALDIKEQAKAEVGAAAALQGELIAAESELQGLQQIYTPGNVRVRSLRARVDELKRQLDKISGTDASLAADAADSPPNSYPSIRKLPLLGVEWADLYRKTKIQETVYELLNQQYELTRMQEAKEIPTIRVIDPPNLPEKKSWPPRLLIILVITASALFATTIWIVGSDHWEGIDRRSPGKVFATHIWGTGRQGLRDVAVRLNLHKVAGLVTRLRRPKE
jgi:capsule polysaccharide export protein KpsE/RkpR